VMGVCESAVSAGTGVAVATHDEDAACRVERAGSRVALLGGQVVTA